MPSKRVSYKFSESARLDIRWLSQRNGRSMTKELEFLVRQAADAARGDDAGDAAQERAATAGSPPPVAQPQPPTLRDGHNYDSLSYSAKHRASQARAAREAVRAVRMKAAKEREDAYANAPKDWSSDPA